MGLGGPSLLVWLGLDTRSSKPEKSSTTLPCQARPAPTRYACDTPGPTKLIRGPWNVDLNSHWHQPKQNRFWQCFAIFRSLKNYLKSEGVLAKFPPPPQKKKNETGKLRFCSVLSLFSKVISCTSRQCLNHYECYELQASEAPNKTPQLELRVLVPIHGMVCWNGSWLWMTTSVGKGSSYYC